MADNKSRTHTGIWGVYNQNGKKKAKLMGTFDTLEQANEEAKKTFENLENLGNGQVEDEPNQPYHG